MGSIRVTVGTISVTIYSMYGHTYSKNMDQLGKVANPSRGQLNRHNKYFPVRVRHSRPASACSSPYSGWIWCLLTSSRVPRRRPYIYLKSPYGSVPSLSGHVIANRWRSLPRVRRHRTSKPQGSFEPVLPWQVTMDHLICASLFHTHHWYEVMHIEERLN